MNGWFPSIRGDGTVASGNAGIYITPPSGSPYAYSALGLMPIYAALTIIYNRNDGTSSVGDRVTPSAYNTYHGSESGNWAGFNASGAGRVDRYNGLDKVATIVNAVAPRFGGPFFGYLSPYQVGPDNLRALIIEGTVAAIGVILTWVWERYGAFHLYQVATGVYTRQIKDHTGAVVSIHDQEEPLIAFRGPGNEAWLVSNTPSDGTF